jgi:hypothetical protein
MAKVKKQDEVKPLTKTERKARRRERAQAKRAGKKWDAAKWLRQYRAQKPGKK